MICMQAAIGAACEGGTATMHLKYPPRMRLSHPRPELNRTRTARNPELVRAIFAASSDPSRTLRFSVLPKGRTR